MRQLPNINRTTVIWDQDINHSNLGNKTTLKQSAHVVPTINITTFQQMDFTRRVATFLTIDFITKLNLAKTRSLTTLLNIH
jgi:hypothetical protein